MAVFSSRAMRTRSPVRSCSAVVSMASEDTRRRIARRLPSGPVGQRRPAHAQAIGSGMPTWWQERQRASYCSPAPTTMVAPSNGAGSPSTSRCVTVAGMPQRWQTACSLSTNSAIASSSGIGPNGRPR